MEDVADVRGCQVSLHRSSDFMNEDGRVRADDMAAENPPELAYGERF
jgi:hypothetical protein